MVPTSQKDRGRHFWLIVGGESEGSGAKLLTVYVPSRGSALAVFSFQEEAQLHLLLSGLSGRWRVKQTCVEELFVLLWAACSGAKWVVLDPVGEIHAREVNCLLSMSGESFLSYLLTLELQVAVRSAQSG